MLKQSDKLKTVIVFGVFDGLHAGHRNFLKQARTRAEYLIVAVALDKHVEALKKRVPVFSLEERMRELSEIGIPDKVVAGDEILGTWEVLKTYRPDGVIVGYDQEALQKALEQARTDLGLAFEIIMALPHAPEKYRSSLLR